MTKHSKSRLFAIAGLPLLINNFQNNSIAMPVNKLPEQDS